MEAVLQGSGVGDFTVSVWIVALLVFVLNIPFGFWRARVQKLSLQWILAVHLPVLVVIAFRIFAGLGWHLVTFPILIGAFFGGQLAGGRLRRLLNGV
jgi:hypothetical protein